MLLVGIFQNSIRGRISGKKYNSNLEKVTKILLFFFPEQKIKFETYFAKEKLNTRALKSSLTTTNQPQFKEDIQKFFHSICEKIINRQE